MSGCAENRAANDRRARQPKAEKPFDRRRRKNDSRMMRYDQYSNKRIFMSS